MSDSKTLPADEHAGDPPIPPDPAATDREDSPIGVAIGGIMAAAFAYGLIVVAVVDVLLVIVSLPHWPLSIESLTLVVLGVALSVTVLFAVVLVLTMPVGLVLLGISWVVACTLRLDRTRHWRILAALAGGATGFLITIPWLWETAVHSGPGWHYIALLLGPGLATLFGQVGGCWWLTPPGSLDESESATPERSSSIGLRFEIRHLLVITAWLAVFLAALKLTGAATPSVIGTLLVWLVFQAGTLPVALKFVRWRWRRAR